ncbi:TIGR03621 family F420-dependent LLM class oxidoreductase [Amorphoplanes digitatis]|uniref:Putative F420-dependent oxidoreductase n=1 Tax=Actinoplanes digitatis TaxID=1868 RepID=A0A7W7I4I1_9ACTN|nr:TIGR03621 family F420-dependent LLM class oxidoreductase [Actinoplanes digitatis]MBB4766284.1 putative F420-dependent oxidoreductase [Actinoplanes digitatis]GID95943.1 LLM class F420-dependent oxidoreductase [Actinoplanes digitatis]
MADFALQAQPTSAADWLDLARRAEEAGFDTLLAADHPGSCASPFVALAAAAAVTTRIRLGSNVSNAAVREPILLASDVATLDVISGGRAVLGLGAGHTPAEWEATGRTRPDVRGRVARCIAVAEATMALLAGEKVTADGPELTMSGAELTQPRPVQERIPLTIGTANSRLLRWAGEHADIVGLTGFGRTLSDGHRHEARWRLSDIDAQVRLAREGGDATLEALVQQVEITDDAGAALAENAAELGMSETELQAVPFVLVGTADEIVAAVRAHRERWGITRYVVRRPGLEALAPLLPRLAEL